MTAIGKLFHIGHVTDEIGPLDDWYDELFVPWHGMLDRHHSARERRWGSLLVIGDGVIETMSPSLGPEGKDGPVGRFLARFGRHWHSLAWYTDDVGTIWDRLVGHGIRLVGAGGAPGRRPKDGAVYTHPKDTLTQLEFYQPPVEHGGPTGSGAFDDPRFDPAWTSRWRAGMNPLSIERVAFATIVGPDLDRAKRVFEDVLGGTLLCEADSTLTGTRSAYVTVGAQTVVELAAPVRLPAESSGQALAAEDVRAYGEACHALTFTVRDLEHAAAHLGRHGVGIAGRDEQTILADPVDTFGAAFRFTTWQVPGDPRGPV